MSRLTLALTLFALGLLASCSPSGPDAMSALGLVQKMTFIKHRNGECFGVVTFTTYAGYTGTSITWVPKEVCER